MYAHISTNRQPQTQTIEQQLDRLQAYVATQPKVTWRTSTSTAMRAIVALS
jgi:hypothetical protein